MNLSIFNSEISPKKFLFVFLIFSLTLFSIHLIFMEWFARKYVIYNAGGILWKDKLLRSKKDQITMIAIGDSHTENGLDIDSEEYFNFAKGGDSAVIMYFKFKHALKKLPKLKTLFLEADYHNFTNYTKDYKHYKQYFMYVDEQVSSNLGIFPDSNKNIFILYSLQENISSILYQELLLQLLGIDYRNPTKKKKNGAVVPEVNWSKNCKSERVIRAKKRARVVFGEEENIEEQLVKYYEKIIKLAKDNGVEVILVRYPISGEYLEQLREATIERLDKYYQTLARKYELKLFDYTKIYLEQTDLFASEDHLNDVGAQQLSKVIDRDLKVELLANN